jgi:hypothetical protein
MRADGLSDCSMLIGWHQACLDPPPAEEGESEFPRPMVAVTDHHQMVAAGQQSSQRCGNSTHPAGKEQSAFPAFESCQLALRCALGRVAVASILVSHRQIAGRFAVHKVQDFSAVLKGIGRSLDNGNGQRTIGLAFVLASVYGLG